MPTNFELTFTQPLLTQLDLGRIGGSTGYARAITNAYVRTLLTGLPGGGTVPPVLPAPALGTPPPPFPIPSVPINNFNRRKRMMERILKKYFEVREYLPVRSNITETYRAIRLIIRKGKRLRGELRQLELEIRRVSTEIRNLPKTLEEIKAAIILLFELEKERITKLYRGLFEFELSIDPNAFQIIFQRELLLINTLKEFKFTADLSKIDEIVSILSLLEDELNAIPDLSYEVVQQVPIYVPSYLGASDLGQDPEDTQLVGITTQTVFSNEVAVRDLKVYLRKQLVSILRRIVAIGNSLVAPEEYISFYRDLVEEDVRLQPVLTVIERYKFAKELLEPQLEKLNKKKKDLVIKIQQTVNDKLKDFQQNLKENIKKNAVKRDPKGKKQQFAKAAKTVRDNKRKYLKKIRDAKSVLLDTKSVIESTTNVVRKSTQFVKQLELLYDQEIKQYIEPPFQGAKDIVRGVSNLTLNDFTAMSVIDLSQLTNIEDDTELVPRAIYNEDGTIIYYVESRPVQVSQESVGDELQGLLGEIDVYLLQAAVNDPLIRKIFAKGIVTKLPSIDHFVEMFEAKSDRLLQPFLDVTSIEQDIKNIDLKITNIRRVLRGDRPQKQRKQSAARYEPDPIPIGEKISFLQLVRAFIIKVKLFLQSIQQKIKETTLKIKLKIEQIKRDLISEVSDQIILLLPIKSDIIDKKNKVAIIRDKKRKIREAKNLLVRRIKQTRFGVRGIKSFITIARNLSEKKIRYTENASAINGLIDSVYGIRILDASSDSAARVLRQEQADKKNTIYEYCNGLELLIDLIFEVKNRLKSDIDGKTSILKDLEQYIKTQTNERFLRDYLILYDQLQTLSTLRDNPKDLLDFVSNTNFNLKIFEETHVRTLLKSLEDSFMGDIQAKYNLVAENTFVKRTFVKTELTPAGRKKVFLIKPFEESMLASAIRKIFEFLNKIIDFFKREIFDKYLKPQINRIKEKINKIREGINEELRVWFRRQMNIDAKLMTVAFNLATRAFWTGFSWTTPNGVRYRCLSIGPFMSLTMKPDSGSSGLIRQVARHLGLQLSIMNGIVTAPPPTGIPPFPFIGYR